MKRILAKEERTTGSYYLIDWEGWALLEAAWEPIENILTATAELCAFEELATRMPLREAFAEASPMVRTGSIWEVRGPVKVTSW